MLKATRWCLMGLCLAFVNAHAVAGLITSAPAGGTTTTFAGGTNCVAGPSAGTVSGFAVVASNDACYNNSAPFGLGLNGTWNGFSLVGGLFAEKAELTSTIRIDLGGLFSAVGGFMNYCDNCPATTFGNPIIAAIAADGLTVLETYDLSTSAPIDTAPSSINEGAFRGISRGSSDIRYFEFGGSFSLLHDITLVSSTAVPEPGSLLLLGLGALGMGWARRRKS